MVSLSVGQSARPRGRDNEIVARVYVGVKGPGAYQFGTGFLLGLPAEVERDEVALVVGQPLYPAADFVALFGGRRVLFAVALRLAHQVVARVEAEGEARPPGVGAFHEAVGEGVGRAGGGVEPVHGDLGDFKRHCGGSPGWVDLGWWRVGL